MYNPDLKSKNENQIWQIDAEQVGQRLDRYLVSVLSDISRTGVQQLIADGLILVNGRPAKAGYLLRLHDEIEALQTAQPQQPLDVQPRAIPLDIAYEDDDLLVVNKAAGMVVHPAPGHYDDTLVNALLARYPQLQAVEGDVRPGIVHRLDRDTSGLMLVAKNVRAQAALIEQMKRHEIMKRYLALVDGNVSLDQGSIDAPIGRDPRHRQQMAVTAVGSRQAITHFRVLQRFARHTLLLVQLETGRTHQIRVHLQAIGYPIVGDPVYGSGNKLRGIALQRQFLHSYQLELIHPASRQKLEIEAPLPDDLQAVLMDESAL
ncbi:RluA family pseudouridine synthase [Ktedonosporobacter rubrisoli]|uniref:Pseudouridine synthase n=1 Tax=Ktedonosporobacter rubrisoli TaxID=2509675 RepID=A0A4V0YYX5_KTERU|nr:RluA family pseudouridine synthase [Ktedonosporobacter rubrisoli]QBD77741.1 RluA family pseudouridine synthase [Ktedonosporobacter rubrisoli]